MTKRMLNRSKKERDLQAALNAAPDYSKTFTQAVEALRHTVAEEIERPVEHDADMNYSSAQKLQIWLNDSSLPIAPLDPQATFRLEIFISSRGRLLAFATLGLSASTAGWKENGLETPRRYWSLVPEEKLPEGIRRLQKRVAGILATHGYSLVEGSILSREAEGHWTKLDGRPATVFEALFSELH